MSDPVTNAEVEDVLSSIRRLVSEDRRPESKAKTAANTDRLVLTQALRVEDDAPARKPDTFVLRDAILPEEKNTGEIDPAPVSEPEIVGAKSAKTIDPSETLSAKIAALETAIGNISAQWEPDSPGEDEYSGTSAPAMEWEDNVDLDATGAPIEDVEAVEVVAADIVETPPTPDEQLLDEEALRELVADIVRSELQGALGERITRNVRKLVRREIHRALAAQDLR